MPTTQANLDSFGDRGPLLRWLVFTGLCVFAFVPLWRFGLIREMVASDRTYLSSIIGLLYVASPLHCLWRTIVISREGDAARRGGALIAVDRVASISTATAPLPVPVLPPKEAP